LKLEIRYIDSTDVKKSTSNMATAIVNELIKGPSNETTFRRTVPAEASFVSRSVSATMLQQSISPRSSRASIAAERMQRR
jgi:spore germination protein GerM